MRLFTDEWLDAAVSEARATFPHVEGLTVTFSVTVRDEPEPNQYFVSIRDGQLERAVIGSGESADVRITTTRRLHTSMVFMDGPARAAELRAGEVTLQGDVQKVQLVTRLFNTPGWQSVSRKMAESTST